MVAVMSGPFLQRGEPAIVNKFARAEMALEMGVDLVIELPVSYAVQPAEWFAYGAVALLEATGVVDSLCFGSESGTLELLRPIAASVANESEELKELLGSRLEQGLSYPTAYSQAVHALLQHNAGCSPEELAQLLQQPNNTLGLHYLIALQRLGSSITPYTIARESAGYHDPSPSHSAIASATAIRRMILKQELDAAAPYVPEAVLAILQREFSSDRGPVTWESFRQPLFHQLFTHTAAELAQIQEVNEGLEHRIISSLQQLTQPDVELLLGNLKTKRYTHTKLQRMLTHILLNHSKESMSRQSLQSGPGYLRVLGFSPQGQQLLKQMKKKASLPLVVKPSALDHPQLQLDIRASAVYANAYASPVKQELFQDYLFPPIRL